MATLLSGTRGRVTCSRGSDSARADHVRVGQPQGSHHDGPQAGPGQFGHVDTGSVFSGFLRSCDLGTLSSFLPTPRNSHFFSADSVSATASISRPTLQP